MTAKPYIAVQRERPDGLADDQVIITHEVTRGWGSRAFKRRVADVDWSVVFGIRVPQAGEAK